MFTRWSGVSFISEVAQGLAQDSGLWEWVQAGMPVVIPKFVADCSAECTAELTRLFAHPSDRGSEGSPDQHRRARFPMPDCVSPREFQTELHPRAAAEPLKAL
jgi:hypothetical protein